MMQDRRQIQFAELESWLNDHRVTEIECLVPDLTGVARGKILPREKFTEDRGMRLPEVVVAMSVTGEYPREGPYFDVVSRNDADMHLVADPSTVRIVPWAADPTAQVIHDCYDRHGRLVPFAPRSVLRRVCELFDRKGWTPVVAPELEFYLVARNTDPDLPLKAPIGRSGRAETSRQAYSIDAVNEFDPLFEDVYDYCEKMELNVDTLIHEVGAGQMEINFFHSAPLDLADEVFLFKRIVREAALRHDMYATFMAKPIAGEPGSAMHVHQSLVSKRDGTQPVHQRGRHAEPGILLVHRRPAEIHTGCDGPFRAVREQLPAPGPIHRRPHQHPVGHRQPDCRNPLAGLHAPGAARGKPRDRRGREPLRRAGGHAGLRLPGHRTAHRAHPGVHGRRLPECATSSRAAWAKPCRCCAPTTTWPTCSARSS